VWCPRNCGAEFEERAARLIDRCIRQAHFPVLETLQPF
jgi:NMD protein affecting ribosome stability and mRNA decay